MRTCEIFPSPLRFHVSWRKSVRKTIPGGCVILSVLIRHTFCKTKTGSSQENTSRITRHARKNRGHQTVTPHRTGAFDRAPPSLRQKNHSRATHQWQKRQGTYCRERLASIHCLPASAFRASCITQLLLVFAANLYLVLFLIALHEWRSVNS